MAYRLKHRESVPAGVKRIAREEIRSAEQYLRGKGGNSRDEAIHEARKSIKKGRALLRLVRPQLGEFYASESARLRDAGEKLSQLRDSGALISTFDELKKGRGKTLGKVSLTAIRRALVLHKKQVEAEMGFRRFFVNTPLSALFEFEVLDGVGDVNIGTVDPGVFKRAGQQTAGGPDKRPPGEIFLVAGLLAYHHDAGGRRAFPENRLRGVAVEVTTLAFLCGLAQLRQRCALRHERRRIAPD